MVNLEDRLFLNKFLKKVKRFLGTSLLLGGLAYGALGCGGTKVECKIDSDCAVTECDDLDGCVGNNYHDYTDAVNSCVEGKCTQEECDSPEVYDTDVRCFTGCEGDDDCNALNKDYCDGTTLLHDEGKCVNSDCTINNSVVQDCDMATCGAECESDGDCAPTDCDDRDGCTMRDWRDYHDVPNTCQADCSCTANDCTVYDKIVTDNDSDGYDIECDGDCNDNDIEINPGTSEDFDLDGKCSLPDLDGKDNNCDGVVDDICMVDVITEPPVTFKMGCDSSIYDDCNGDNLVHEVTLTRAYEIDQFEVTNYQYLKCEEAGVCSAPSRNDSVNYSPYHDNSTFANFPVIYISQSQAEEYCAWAGKELPTEAKWEYAARSGDEREFPWGNDDPSCDLLNYNFCVGDMAQVGDYPSGASSFGALDMAGNAREWVKDWFAPYSGNPETDPEGPSSGTKKVVKGGTYFNGSPSIKTYARYSIEPNDTSESRGFRCIKKE